MNLQGFLVSESAEELREKDKLLESVVPQDLMKFGMIPEFVGRLPVQVATHSLSEEMLIRILTEPKNAFVSQFQYLLQKDDGVRFTAAYISVVCPLRGIGCLQFNPGT